MAFEGKTVELDESDGESSNKKVPRELELFTIGGGGVGTGTACPPMVLTPATKISSCALWGGKPGLGGDPRLLGADFPRR